MVVETAQRSGWLPSKPPTRDRAPTHTFVTRGFLRAAERVVATTDLEQPANPVVLRLPAKIDLVSAGRVGEQLCSAFTLGAAVVIADLTSTLFCDSAGIRQFVLAHNYATAHGAQLRFVIPERNLLSVLMMTGLDRFLSVYPSLDAALATGH